MQQTRVDSQQEVILETYADLAKRRLQEASWTPGKRLEALLRGEAPDRIHFQLFSYSAAWIGRSIYDFFFDPVVRLQATCAQIIRWGEVELQNSTRIYSYKSGESLGAKLEYSQDRPPSTKGYILSEPQRFYDLPSPNMSSLLEPDLWSIRAVNRYLGDFVGPSCSFVYPPFSWVATYMREPNLLLTDLFDRPSFVHDLCRFATDLEMKAIRQLSDAAPCAFFMPDGFCELLSPEQYSEFALPYMAELINSLPEVLFYIATPRQFRQITEIYELVKKHKRIICMGSSINPNNPLRSREDMLRFRDIMIELDRPFQLALNQSVLKQASALQAEEYLKELVDDAANSPRIMIRTDVIDSKTPAQVIDALVHALWRYGLRS
jgi:hypothetical protein